MSNLFNNLKKSKTFLMAFMGVFSLLCASTPHKEIKWKKLFDVHAIDKTYVPQAIEVYKNYVLFSVHAQDKKSALIVFEKSGERLEYLFEVDMPKEATHTSDFDVVGDTLYAIDYASNKIYQIDLPSLIEQRKLVIDDGFYLNMSRTGSLVIVSYDNETYVLISQFILTTKLSVFKLSTLKEKGELQESDILFTIDAHRFIQGLYTQDNLLLMSTNNWGVDTITIADVEQTFKTKSINDAAILKVNAPYKMVEDIAMIENKIITSDEESNYIYESQQLIFKGSK